MVMEIGSRNVITLILTGIFLQILSLRMERRLMRKERGLTMVMLNANQVQIKMYIYNPGFIIRNLL